MKKQMKSCFFAAAVTSMVMGASFMSYAGSWQNSANGWWWQNDDGTWPANTWQWIDGNGDGIAQCYYFNGEGICLMNTTTPDGSTVDGNGAWMVNGVIQTQAQQPAGADQKTVKANLFELPVEHAKFTSEAILYTEHHVAGGEDWYGSLWVGVPNTQSEQYVDYYLGGAYTTLRMKVVPDTDNFRDFGDKGLDLYIQDQETGKQLAKKTGIMNATNKFELEADVTGVQYLRIYLKGTGGNSMYLLMKEGFLY